MATHIHIHTTRDRRAKDADEIEMVKREIANLQRTINASKGSRDPDDAWMYEELPKLQRELKNLEQKKAQQARFASLL